MQTGYLRYMVEIERTRSITQAASNLYLTQPSLSRILHDIEQQLGYAIFERSNRGVRPTREGLAFLQHAKRILGEMEAIEGLGGGKRPRDRFRICMPRSADILRLAAEYLNALPQDHALDAMLRECHVRKAFELLASSEVDLGIIRFRAEYQDYFEDSAAGLRLEFEPLNSYRYGIILRKDNPLAERDRITVADLRAFTEITHGDTFRSRREPEEGPSRRIYSVDRHAQLMLLMRIPNAFMWSTALLPEELEPWKLVQRDVEDNRMEYRDALLHIPQELLSDIEQAFMELVREHSGTMQ